MDPFFSADSNKSTYSEVGASLFFERGLKDCFLAEQSMYQICYYNTYYHVNIGESNLSHLKLSYPEDLEMRVLLPNFAYVDEIVHMELILTNHNRRSELPVKISVVSSGKYKFVQEVKSCTITRSQNA